MSKSPYEIFRTDTAKGLELGAESVDLVTATIGGAAIMEMGVVKDGRFEVDRKTLGEVVQLGNQPKMGVKMRFGHPSMSDDALGSFLGRAKNFRIDPSGTIARADMFFDSTSFHTPNGNLGGYVLSLAQSDPGAFGVSVSVKAAKEQRLNDDGTPQTDQETGEVLVPLLRVKSLLATDFVDDPAATNGLHGGKEEFGIEVDHFGLNAQTLLSAEAMKLLEEVVQRPDVIKRAHVFFNRAFDQLEGLEKSEPEKKEMTMANDVEELTVAELTKKYPEQIRVIQRSAKDEGTQEERERVHGVLEFQQSMKCDVWKESLEAVEQGFSVDRAQVEFLKVERQAREKEANKPSGLKEDSMPDKEEFSSYEEAWQTIKRIEQCSTIEAMRRAQDRHPKLYKDFLANCPRGKK